ncbi:hypothetical protein B0H19DRAFT_1255408 [Mycena capillaripes]|nr:hypothetical protein B0H19DRAFT_1255408 [Mycena capillaripes]
MSDAAAQLAYDIQVNSSLHLVGIGTVFPSFFYTIHRARLFSVIMYLDHLITLDDEINFLWKHVGSPSTYWFFAVRYAGFAGNIPVTAFSFNTFPQKVVLVGTQLIVSVVMLLRVYALYGRSVRLLTLSIMVALPLVAVVLWSMQGQHSSPIDGFPGCHVSMTQSTAYHLAASWEALFLFDTFIFALIVGKTYVTWRRAGYSHLPIHILILRDGAIYFAAIALANLCNILTFYYLRETQLAGPVLAGSLSTFASCMSVTMMGRLMLNLHKQAKDGVLSELHLSLQSDVVFAEEMPSPVSAPPDVRNGVLEMQLR